MEAHHNWYERGRDPWDYPLECLITLCAMCHEAETFYRAQMERDLLDTLRKKAFLGSDISSLVQYIEKMGVPLPRAWETRPADPDRHAERDERRKELGLKFDRWGNKYWPGVVDEDEA